MATIKEKIKACDYVLANILDEQERIIYANENRILRLNTNQFENGMGSDDKVLFNKNPLFDGTYSLSTSLLDSNKRAGDLYTFHQTGDFLRGLQLELRPNLVEMDIFSTGTGGGKKADFFAGYTNLFGLDSESKRILNYEIILPDLQKWIKTNIE